MKKFIAGFICGALLFSGVSVFAATKSPMIGKRVDGVASVIVNGKKLEKDAILIEGTSYLPVRAMTEAIGGKIISANGGEIQLATTTTTSQEVITDPEEFAKRGAEEARRQEEAAARQAEIRNLQEAIKTKQTLLDLKKKRLDELNNEIENGQDLVDVGGVIPFKESDVYRQLIEEVEKVQAEIEQIEAEIAELEQRKSALEAQQ